MNWFEKKWKKMKQLGSKAAKWNKIIIIIIIMCHCIRDISNILCKCVWIEMVTLCVVYFFISFIQSECFRFQNQSTRTPQPNNLKYSANKWKLNTKNNNRLLLFWLNSVHDCIATRTGDRISWKKFIQEVDYHYSIMSVTLKMIVWRKKKRHFVLCLGFFKKKFLCLSLFVFCFDATMKKIKCIFIIEQIFWSPITLGTELTKAAFSNHQLH